MVDDSVVIRRILTEELSGVPGIGVVDCAATGQIALAKMNQVTPDVVILDVEMPEMDGLAILVALRKNYPRLPVIMFSAVTERGASATLDALTLGATDYFTKPSGPGGIEESRRVIREELAPAIGQLCAPKKTVTQSSSQPTLFGPAPGSRGSRVDVVVIGASTGGPNALTEIFSELPRDLPVPILIVQHMLPLFTRYLADRITTVTKVQVDEATSGAVVRPGRVLIAPGDFHMVVERDGTQMRAKLHQEPPENSCRPAADTLFRSAARVYGAGVLAVVLTGMGQDALRGCEVVRAAGGQIIVQDQETSVVWGMPGFVAKAGLADEVLPQSLIANGIVSRVRAAGGQK